MNEAIITSAVAALRQPSRSSDPSLAPRLGCGRDRTPSPNETGHPKCFVAPGGPVAVDVVPWPDRPRISGIRRAYSQAFAHLGHSRLMWTGAGIIAAAALTRGALHLGIQSGPVIVHLVWPV